MHNSPLLLFLRRFSIIFSEFLIFQCFYRLSLQKQNLYPLILCLSTLTVWLRSHRSERILHTPHFQQHPLFTYTLPDSILFPPVSLSTVYLITPFTSPYSSLSICLSDLVIRFMSSSIILLLAETWSTIVASCPIWTMQRRPSSSIPVCPWNPCTTYNLTGFNLRLRSTRIFEQSDFWTISNWSIYRPMLPHRRVFLDKSSPHLAFLWAHWVA